MSVKFLIYSVLFISLFPFQLLSQGIDLDQMLSQAENSYFSADYNSVISLSQNVLAIMKNNPNLAEDHLFIKAKLIFGSSYLKKGYAHVAELAFTDVLMRDPNYEIDEKKYGEQAKEVFQKLKNGGKEKKSEVTEVPLSPTEKKTISPEKSAADEQMGDSLRETIQVRVIKKGAILRVSQDEQSEIIKDVPLGAVLAVMELGDKWIKVKLNPNKDGIVIAGYILLSFLELLDKFDK
jgi:hypothetical protein